MTSIDGIVAYEDPDVGVSKRERRAARGTVHINAANLAVLDQDEKPSVQRKRSQKVAQEFNPMVSIVMVGHSDDINAPDGTARDISRRAGILDRVFVPAIGSGLSFTTLVTGYDFKKMQLSNPGLIESAKAFGIHAASTYFTLQHPQLMNALIPEQLTHGVEAIKQTGLASSPVAKAPRFAYSDFASPGSGGLKSLQKNGIDYVLFADRVSEHKLHPTLEPTTGNCFWLTDGLTAMRAIRFDPATRDRFKWTMRGENGYTPERFVDETVEDVLNASPARRLTILYWRVEDISVGGDEGVSRFNEVVERLGTALKKKHIETKPLSREALLPYEPLWDASAEKPVELKPYVWSKTPTQKSLAEALAAVEYNALNVREQRRFLTVADEVFSDAAYNVDDPAVDAATRHLSYRLLEEARRVLVDLPHRQSVFITGSFSSQLSKKDEEVIDFRMRVRYRATE